MILFLKWWWSELCNWKPKAICNHIHPQIRRIFDITSVSINLVSTKTPPTSDNSLRQHQPDTVNNIIRIWSVSIRKWICEYISKRDVMRTWILWRRNKSSAWAVRNSERFQRNKFLIENICLKKNLSKISSPRNIGKITESSKNIEIPRLWSGQHTIKSKEILDNSTFHHKTGERNRIFGAVVRGKGKSSIEVDLKANQLLETPNNNKSSSWTSPHRRECFSIPILNRSANWFGN